MITPEIISYIKSQLASGITRDSISLNLVKSGWQIQDVEEAFTIVSNPASISPSFQPTISQPAVAVNTGWGLGKIILSLFIVGFLGLLISGGLFAYYTYSKFVSFSNTVCAGKSVTEQADCQQNIKNFLGFLLSKSQNMPTNIINDENSNNDENNNEQPTTKREPVIGGLSGKALIDFYNQPCDFSNVISITKQSSGLSHYSEKVDTSTTKMLVVDPKAGDKTIEKLGQAFLGGRSLVDPETGIEVGLFNSDICNKSWWVSEVKDVPTDGLWFTVKDDGPEYYAWGGEYIIRVQEFIENGQKELVIQKRSIYGDDKNTPGWLDIYEIAILGETHSNKSVVYIFAPGNYDYHKEQSLEDIPLPFVAGSPLKSSSYESTNYTYEFK